MMKLDLESINRSMRVSIASDEEEELESEIAELRNKIESQNYLLEKLIIIFKIKLTSLIKSLSKYSFKYYYSFQY